MRKGLISIVLVLIVLLAISLVGCSKNDNNVKDSNNEDALYNRVSENEAKSSSDKSNDIPAESSDIYEGIIANYKNAVAEYDLEDIDSDAKLEQKYPLINLSLIMHIARYSSEGVKLTYAFYDVNKDGTNELLVCADNACGAIYSYDKNSNQVIKIHFLDTMERGNLSIYDNGVILTSGAGGAALHYYEYGRISEDTISYEVLESVIEEYVDGNEIPIYKKYDTEEVLDYKSLTEIDEKYISDAKPIENINFVEM